MLVRGGKRTGNQGGGGIRSSRSAVSLASAALVKLLLHPDSRVKCAAAEALVFFRVAPEHEQHEPAATSFVGIEPADKWSLPHTAAVASGAGATLPAGSGGPGPIMRNEA